MTIKEAIKTTVKSNKKFATFTGDQDLVNEMAQLNTAKKELAKKEAEIKAKLIKAAEVDFVNNEMQQKTVRAISDGGETVDITFKEHEGEVKDADEAHKLGLSVGVNRKVEMNRESASMANVEHLVKRLGKEKFQEWFTVAEKTVAASDISIWRFSSHVRNDIESVVKFSNPSISVKKAK